MTAPEEWTSYLRTIAIDPESIRTDDARRTITAQAVPYNVDQPIPSEGIVERFAPGAFAHQLKPGAIDRVHVTHLHQRHGGEVIGRLLAGSETDRGLQVEMHVSKTTRGNDTLELVRDGALSEVSIGFRSNSKGSRREGQNLVVRTRASLFEVAIVPEGAYGRNATVSGLRSMGDLLRAATDDEPAEDETDVEVVVPGMSLDQARALAASIPMLPIRMIA